MAVDINECNYSMNAVDVKINNYSKAFHRMSDIEKKSAYKVVKNLISLLTSYCTQLPVLGHNSSRYDVCLVRKQLFTHNELEDSKKHLL